MGPLLDVGIDLAIITILLIGIAKFRAPRGARFGNYAAATALGAAVAVVLVRHGLVAPHVALGAALVGAALGTLVALRVDMIGIPSMVAFQHGMGGVAAMVVAFAEMTRDGDLLSPVGRASGFLGLAIGAATFSGSMVASAKLGNRMKQAPTEWPLHGTVLVLLLGSIATLVALLWRLDVSWTLYGLLALGLAAALFGYAFSLRIGGADMPVLISFLNATAGVAAAFCGIVIQNRLLIACGATVASSGSILTHMMCKAMNRSLASVLLGIKGSAKGLALATAGAPLRLSLGADGDGAEDAEPTPSPAAPPRERANAPPTAVPKADDLSSRMAAVVEAALEAARVIVIPGYGMALARAQFDVVRLTSQLEKMGKEVKFAIHPVAGRMPGHMNVLLAEADVDYEKLCEMDDVNPLFATTDLVLIVGACDVVNPAALAVEGTPLSGMPILRADEARRVVVCNLDERPGYSGVPNPLYHDPKTILLLGDARATVAGLLERIRAAQPA